MEKVIFTGTHRVCLPEDTLNMITPLLGHFGITRLADVSGLDVLGIPVVLAVRPLGKTLSVSEGKGSTLTLAKISAAMEAIELWHAENAVPEPEIRDASALDLGLPYAASSLNSHPRSLFTEHTVTNWIMACTAITREAVPVPWSMVQMGRYSREDWLLCSPNASSNGLAAGNTRHEAVIHSLYEIIERDATDGLSRVPAHERACVDLHTVNDAWCAEMIGRILDAGAWLEVAEAPNRFGVPCFAAYIWVEEMSSSIAIGSGAHSDPAVAFSRAVTEAAQSRLTTISGSRDDILPRTYIQPEGALPRPATTGIMTDWNELISQYDWLFATDEDEEAWVAQLVKTVTGSEPMVIDLSASADLAVVKVICPGVNYLVRHDIPRPETRN
jgi:ribosomal protein S12 methylthiotransferase accessory factor